MSASQRKIFLLIISSVLIVVGIWYFESKKPTRMSDITAPIISVLVGSSARKETREEKLKKYPIAKEITTPDGFINTALLSSGQPSPITIGEFVGKKVVLLDIWTYSCINCQRTLPYLNAWHEKYKDKGLTIIGLHTPEFEFEKKYENVLAAVKKFGIKYPVVLDNDFSTWNAYGNRYWPRKYLIDIDGFVVYDHIGEGGYEETEKKIQELLDERGELSRPTNTETVDASRRQSPETYFGALRNTTLANGSSGAVGEQSLALPASVAPDVLYLDGAWNISGEFAENKSSGAKIVFRYRAKNVYLVARSDAGVDAQVLIDGKPIGAEAGEDVKNGVVTIKEDRLYRIVEGKEYGEHTLEIIIKKPGVQAFAFTFG